MSRTEFNSLIDQLSALLEKQALVKDAQQLFSLGAKRFDLEQRLIGLLRSATATEQRQSIRVDCDLAGRVRLGSSTEVACTIRNLSCGGAGFTANRVWAMDATVELAILPTPKLLDSPLVIGGAVRWTNGSTVGVQFARPNAALERRIFGVVLALLRASPPP